MECRASFSSASLHPSSLPISFACMLKLFPPNTHFSLLKEKKGKEKHEICLVPSFSALSCFSLHFFFTVITVTMLDKCSAFPLCSLSVRGSGQNVKL